MILTPSVTDAVARLLASPFALYVLAVLGVSVLVGGFVWMLVQVQRDAAAEREWKAAMQAGEPRA